MNKGLWEKIKYVYDHQDEYNLDHVQKSLLKKKYEGFVNSGALLSEEKQKEIAALNLELYDYIRSGKYKEII